MGHTMLEGKMKDSINWGFIGCGRVVQTKSGNAFRSIQDSSIHTIMRRDIQKHGNQQSYLMQNSIVTIYMIFFL